MSPDSFRLPEGFVYLDEFYPEIQVDLAYASANNFVGEPILGYTANRAILTRPAAEALGGVQNDLLKRELGLRIFDAYRPRQAISHFLEWARSSDQSGKAQYFPNIDKSELFNLGYLGLNSAHCRGSTVDLTLVDLSSGQPLDMGTRFDFFDPASWTNYPDLPAAVLANRQLLRKSMLDHGFVGFDMEWWHFTLAEEPYSEMNFDFPVR